ncbi:hypothetical protein SXIM_41120 [Streptomyces xiamenensis]|uniref:Uncharacterized protein n=1 Tax=Streptomyces xiamenensis TaxID=408015 RepID=A0A0F7CPZ0_9ACTN|nr:hypothetical protein SXIM_41120 [Streptomyces xiamenensis]
MQQFRRAIESRIDAGADVFVFQLVQCGQALSRIVVRSDVCERLHRPRP